MVTARLSVELWLEQSPEVRAKLKEIFQIPRSKGSEIVNDPQGIRVVSDGHSYDDLKAIGVESMQQYLNSSEEDYFKLFNALIDKLTRTEPIVVEPTIPDDQRKKNKWKNQLDIMRSEAEASGLLVEYRKLLTTNKK